MKKCRFLSFVAMVLALSLMLSTVAFANTVTSEGTNGRITTTVTVVGGATTPTSTFVGNNAERITLLTRIQEARNLLAATRIAEPPGAEIPADEWYAPQAAHTALLNVISAVAGGVTNVEVNAGQQIDVEVSIANNSGFAGMILQFGVPKGMDIVGITPHPAGWTAFDQMFETFMDEGTVVIGSEDATYNYVYAGWAGRSANLTGNGRLFTIRLSVPAGTTARNFSPLTISAGNAVPPHDEIPTNLARQELDISLPCGTKADGVTAAAQGYIAQITVR